VARKTIRVSDKSGQEIADGKASSAAISADGATTSPTLTGLV